MSKTIKMKWLALARECLIRADIDPQCMNGSEFDPLPNKSLEWAFEFGNTIEGKVENE